MGSVPAWHIDVEAPATVAVPKVRRLVLVTVGRDDLRAQQALEYAWSLPAIARRALHVAVDEDELWQLGRTWMGRDEPVPLHTVEVRRTVAETIADVVEVELASGFDEVVVVTGRLGLRRRRHRLLHDRTSDAIARAVMRIPRALAAVLTVASF